MADRSRVLVTGRAGFTGRRVVRASLDPAQVRR
jgi:nucleoside-diphosphate-sugar epimerase